MDKVLLREAVMKHQKQVAPPFDVIMEVGGFDAVYLFCELYGGTTLYVPNKRTVFARCLEQEALLEFNGGNHRELALKYGFSESHLRRLLRRSK